MMEALRQHGLDIASAFAVIDYRSALGGAAEDLGHILDDAGRSRAHAIEREDFSRR
ncbi:hypothetical protein [Bradyrhizobium iriomotense]|uniref:hypothetical protein n=1 Tax=Bradyrhizobium iriomotense TaxID=441950 RepID=UPI001B8A20F7|nr:hypothetical protein [Bradyrhizobium iriomotense]MBR0781160.1 hypothetical protein [Bradyrhizobium iriomotense]